MTRSARLHPQGSRRGACAVEFAFVGPVLLLILVCISFGGLSAFRYIQLANVARHAARWAAVHGTAYANATGTPVASAQDVYDSAIKPRLVATKPQQLQWQVDWSADGRVVTVSLQITQAPEAYFVGGTISTQCSMFVVK